MQVTYNVNPSAACFQPPPLVIWGDKHNSPINYKSIHDSLIFLRSIMGCNHFAWEYDNNVNLQAVIERTALSLKNAIEYKSVVNFNGLEKYASHLHKKIIEGAEMVPALQTRLDLFNKVERLGLAYQGVDTDLGNSRSNLHQDHSEYTYAGAQYAERNESIVNNTAKITSDPARSGVLLMVGLRHFLALAEALQDKEEITSRYTVLFLYVSDESDPDLPHIASKKEELEKSCPFKFNMILYGENSQKEIRTFLESNCKYRPVAIKNLS